ncbi:MAG: MBL fold metallo-hydrolase [Bacteroidales bacterium]|jgi:phosphoribosyl 1,2-cyclic phosphodiesterase|nr:MBL fold metallo-hydrolase [Bacteroidales bacterium]
MDLFSCLSPFVFCSFASGSSGNCYYVGRQDEGILVDVGITAKQLKEKLLLQDLSRQNIKAILITHDHIDHVLGLEAFTKDCPIPIYAHSDCLRGLAEGKATKHLDTSLFHEIEPLQPFQLIGIAVEAFPVMHDGRGAMGYHFAYEGRTLTIATDIGMLDKVVKEQIRKADNLVIEANYDVEMLEKGSYPYVLKQRIAGPFGHLSNVESARFLAEIYHPGIKNIMLCHLSENNNTPERAMQCLYEQFRKKHVRADVNTSIFPLPRHKSTGFVYL